jgi:FkbM family methyltransferase
MPLSKYTKKKKIKHESINSLDSFLDNVKNNEKNNEENNEEMNDTMELEKQYYYYLNENADRNNNNNKQVKTKKDYTTLLNYNYILSKEESRAAFKQGKGYGAGTIMEEVTACVSLLTVKPLIFIDIGAHVGDYTNEILRRYPNINAFLFEPQSAHKTTLENAYSKMPNVKINSCALSNNDGKQSLYYDKEGSVLASLTNRRLEHFNVNMNNSETVDIKRFDTFWKTTNYNEHTIIDYVKIDVEGWELSVLQGFGELINNMRVIQFEFGGSNIDTRTFFQDFWYFFKGLNFALYRITPNGILPMREYSEHDEFFSTTNYIAVNRKYNDIEIIDKYQDTINQNKNQPKKNSFKHNKNKSKKNIPNKKNKFHKK